MWKLAPVWVPHRFDIVTEVSYRVYMKEWDCNPRLCEGTLHTGRHDLGRHLGLDVEDYACATRSKVFSCLNEQSYRVYVTSEWVFVPGWKSRPGTVTDAMQWNTIHDLCKQIKPVGFPSLSFYNVSPEMDFSLEWRVLSKCTAHRVNIEINGYPSFHPKLWRDILVLKNSVRLETCLSTLSFTLSYREFKEANFNWHFQMKRSRSDHTIVACF